MYTSWPEQIIKTLKRGRDYVFCLFSEILIEAHASVHLLNFLSCISLENILNIQLAPIQN